jgi:hypothetical protein
MASSILTLLMFHVIVLMEFVHGTLFSNMELTEFCHKGGVIWKVRLYLEGYEDVFASSQRILVQSH